MSHRTPFTCEINAFAAKLFEISLATSNGDVTHFFPSLTVPSGNVILTKAHKTKTKSMNESSVTERGNQGLVCFLLDGIGGEGLEVSELTGLLGLEELDALGDDLIEVGLVLGLVGGHGGEWWRRRI
jgi:hypothetical protein